ncbi:MAG: HAMP domain-containing protein [Chloroflexi bacterium]|nr:HAMP domain-containing protein [Chloroflexota bacterium]
MRLGHLSLGAKLSLSFAGVAVVAVGIVALLMQRAATSEFTTYLTMTELMSQMMGSGATGPGMMGSSIPAVGAPEQEFLRRLGDALWVAAALSAVAAAVMGLLLARQLVRPLARLTGAAHRVAAGDLSQRIPVEGGEEAEELAQSFNTMAESLARDQQLRRNFVADIAHELRTPLTVLQGQIEAMLDGVLASSPEQLASLHEEVMLLSRLVTDLRTLSLADAGMLELHREETDAAELARGVVRAMEGVAQGKGVRLRVEAAEGVPAVWADRDRITQVLHNLLSNAIRYSPSGDEVVVGLLPCRQSDGTSWMETTVVDHGPGIAESHLPHIFERFYHADSAPARGVSGSGIGLAVVKELVEAHGGRVWAESKIGEGSTFGFTLPVGASRHQHGSPLGLVR